MDKKQVEEVVDGVLEGWSEQDHPRDEDGKFAGGEGKKRRRDKDAMRRMGTYEFNGFTFKKPSDEELERNKSMPPLRVSGRRR